MTDFYANSSDPSNDSDLDSSVIRAEYVAIAAGFAKIAGYTGNGGKIVAINAGGTAQEAITTTGTGSGVRATSPTLVTPVLGVATATSINKLTLTQPATGATLTLTDGKTLAATHTLTLAGTDGTTMTFPSTSATIARTDAANTFTGVQSMTSPDFTTSITTTSTTFTAFAGATTLLTIGGTGATSVFAIPGTLQATGTTGALTVAGGVYIAKALNAAGSITGSATAQPFKHTGTAATNTAVFLGTGYTTGNAYFQLGNTSGGLYIGIESSTGGSIINGSAAYTTVLAGSMGLSFSGNAGTNEHMTISTAGAVNISGNITGAAISGTTGAFSGSVAITKASGNNLSYSLIQTGVAQWEMLNVATTGLFRIDETGVSSWLTIAKTTGVVTIPNLAGVGSRAVVVDANGVLSAP